MRDDFAIFILTHGRADHVITYNAVKKSGYTGKLYFLIDNEDSTADEYYSRYGDKVVMFDKKEIAKRIDAGDNRDERTAILYARNACFEVAKDLGLKYFLQLDDDFTDFMWRYIEGRKLKHAYPTDLDAVFEAMCEFLEVSGAQTVAFAQGGDFIGGKENQATKKGLLRKAMNTFFCATDRPVRFKGRMNEDVTAYTLLASQGEIFFTVPQMMVNQVATQAGEGGMSEVYMDSGTYVKSFYSVMYCPSCVKVALMGDKHKRIHHRVNWAYAVPKILDESWKKVQ